jgi:hypothetical protein
MADSKVTPENTATGTVKAESNVPMIIHRERVMRGTEIVETVHGPMPVSEWDAYAKEKGL